MGGHPSIGQNLPPPPPPWARAAPERPTTVSTSSAASARISNTRCAAAAASAWAAAVAASAALSRSTTWGGDGVVQEVRVDLLFEQGRWQCTKGSAEGAAPRPAYLGVQTGWGDHRHRCAALLRRLLAVGGRGRRGGRLAGAAALGRLHRRAGAACTQLRPQRLDLRLRLRQLPVTRLRRGALAHLLGEKGGTRGGRVHPLDGCRRQLKGLLPSPAGAPPLTEGEGGHRANDPSAATCLPHVLPTHPLPVPSSLPHVPPTLLARHHNPTGATQRAGSSLTSSICSWRTSDRAACFT